MYPEHIQELPNLSGIPKPYFISTLFPETPVAICRPLDPPFEEYAVTHHGVVFKYKPLNLMYTNTNGVIKEEHSFDFFLLPDITQEDLQYVTLHDSRSGITNTFYVHRLALDRFYGVSIYDNVDTMFLDGSKGNPHMNNLEAILR